MMNLRQNCRMQNRKADEGQRGVALIAALLALVLIAAITAGMIILSTTETSISANFRDEQTAYFAAKGGIEEIRDRMRPSAANTLRQPANLLPTTPPGTPNSVLYVLNPNGNEVVAPWNGQGATSANQPPYPDDEICKQTSAVPCQVNALVQNQLLPSGNGWYASTNASNAYKPAQGSVFSWKWVRVTLKINKTSATSGINSVDGTTIGKRVCWNGIHEVLVILPEPTTCANLSSGDQQVYEITSLGVTSSGSRRIVQMDITHAPPLTVPAAITIDSTGQTQCQMQGGSVSGIDHATPPGASVAGIGISSSSGSCQTQGTSVTGGGNCTAIPNVCGNLPMPPPLTPGPVGSGGLPDTINQLIASADQTFTGNPPNGANLGTLASPLTTVVNSPGAMINALNGAGILIINAGAQTQLEVNGNFIWNGLVIVYSSAGQVQVQIDTGTGSINGALLMASNSNAQIQFQFQGTGFAGGINYNSSYVSMTSANNPLKAIADRELMF